jgi:hypothetical protein
VTQLPKKEGKWRRLAREQGLFLAVYAYFVAEATTIIAAYLLYIDVVGAGDALSLIHRLGLNRFLDVDGYLQRKVTIFGVEVGVQLGLNYCLAGVLLIPFAPLLLWFSLVTGGPVKRFLHGWLRGLTKSKA